MVILRLAFPDARALRATFEEQLSKGRLFVPNASATVDPTPCELLLELGARVHRLMVEVVYVRAEDPGRGIGVKLATLEPDEKEALRAFVDQSDEAGDATLGGEEHAALEDDAANERREERSAPQLHERIRGLSSAEQQRVASGGTLTERIALERVFGATVWDTLLRNPRITVPEVARIARKGTVPRPLVEAIAANAAWLVIPEVQRALLSNPRSSASVIGRVLQTMPRSDLLRVPQQTAYPASVRMAARTMLGR